MGIIPLSKVDGRFWLMVGYFCECAGREGVAMCREKLELCFCTKQSSSAFPASESGQNLELL